jgi:hypothetical protein
MCNAEFEVKVITLILLLQFNQYQSTPDLSLNYQKY